MVEMVKMGSCYLHMKNARKLYKLVMQKIINLT